MTADEIRKDNHRYERDEWYWLKEIAAQLAEANEIKRRELELKRHE
jgi:hypothetical protein